MYLDDIEDDPVFNPGVTYPGTEPPVKDYGDMVVKEEQPDEDKLDDEVIDKYLNAELIFGIGTNSERWGRVIKRSWGLMVIPLGMCILTLCLTPVSTKSNSQME